MNTILKSIYYTWKNIKSAYNNSKFKIPDFTLISLMDRILLQALKIISSTSLKNMKL